MEFFAEIVNDFQLLTLFAETSHLKMLDRVLNTPPYSETDRTRFIMSEVIFLSIIEIPFKHSPPFFEHFFHLICEYKPGDLKRLTQKREGYR